MIDGKVVRLEALDPERDVTPDYLSWLNDPAVFRFLGSKFPQTTNSARNYVLGISRPNFLAKIVVRADGRHVGNLAMQGFDPIHRNMELGIVVGDPVARGKGFGREACALAIGYAFDHLGVQKVTAGTVSGNEAMKKVFLALGFTIEGTLRSHYELEGKRLDVLRFGLLRGELRATPG
jgi:[ribosomal protein S5]-alanine N-acetyltransferase